MITTGMAMRLAEAGAEWLRRKEPSAWFDLCLVVNKDDGSHAAMPRDKVCALLERANKKAHEQGKLQLAAEFSRGVDLVKAAAKAEVPLVVLIDDAGEVTTGVLMLRMTKEVLRSAGPTPHKA